jgi:hypothetical protein
MTEHLSVASTTTNVDETRTCSLVFPALIWVVRDFALKLQRDGVAITPKQYLENTLLPNLNGSDGAKKNNELRSKLKTIFPERDCILFPQPTDDKLLH